MSALERCGTTAVCVVVSLSAALGAARMASRAHAPAAAAAAQAAELTTPRAQGTAEAELVVWVGRYRVSWPEDARALGARLRTLAEQLCLSASAVRLVDYAACRNRLMAALQDTCPQVRASIALGENRR
jgi:hypothetical protein